MMQNHSNELISTKEGPRHISPLMKPQMRNVSFKKLNHLRSMKDIIKSAYEEDCSDQKECMATDANESSQFAHLTANSER